jgi:phosphoglycolate phosphatase
MKQSFLVIFDIDGTLLQTDRVPVPAVKETFAAFGLPEPDGAAVCSFFGVPVEEYEAWITAQCPPGQADEILAAANRRELQCIGETGRLYPGVREMLEALRGRGAVLAICSNGPRDYVGEFVRAYDLDVFFRLVYARDTVYSGKEEMIGEILARIPERPFAVIGDRHDDISAAHAHGGRAIAAAWGFGSEEEHADADAVAGSVSEIAGCLDKLFE